MKKAAIATTFSVLLANVREIIVKRFDRNIGGGVLKDTLRKVLFAPVNTFFDVTPIGKILKIFQQEINIFREEMLYPIRRIVDLSAHFIIVLVTLFIIGPQETVIALLIAVCIWLYITPRFNAAAKWFNRNCSIHII